MLSNTNNFKEVDLKKLVEIKGIPREYFVKIIQYLYSDHFYMSNETETLEYFLNLLIYSDYFILNRMTQIISRYIGNMVAVENVIAILTIANAHNAPQLLDFCIQFICIHEQEFKMQSEWSNLKSNYNLVNKV